MFAVVMMTAGVLYAQTTDSITQARLDSIDAKMKMLHPEGELNTAESKLNAVKKLKEISISAPKPVYSMTGEVVNYNVENDETVRDLTAWDASRMPQGGERRGGYAPRFFQASEMLNSEDDARRVRGGCLGDGGE